MLVRQTRRDAVKPSTAGAVNQRNIPLAQLLDDLGACLDIAVEDDLRGFDESSLSDDGIMILDLEALPIFA